MSPSQSGLRRYMLPIASGLTPQLAGTGHLNPRREAELTRSLRELETARRSALLASQQYLMRVRAINSSAPSPTEVQHDA